MRALLMSGVVHLQWRPEVANEAAKGASACERRLLLLLQQLGRPAGRPRGMGRPRVSQPWVPSMSTTRHYGRGLSGLASYSRQKGPAWCTRLVCSPRSPSV